MLERVEVNDINGAVELGKKSQDFVARILVYALSHKEHSLGNAFTRAANQEMQRFSQGLPTLDTCTSSDFLLGAGTLHYFSFNSPDSVIYKF
jgi:biopolymer transport protein ExbB